MSTYAEWSWWVKYGEYGLGEFKSGEFHFILFLTKVVTLNFIQLFIFYITEFTLVWTTIVS